MNTNVCACGRRKAHVSKRCAYCHDQRRQAQNRRARTCRCGKSKSKSAKQCLSCKVEKQTTQRCACGQPVSSSQSRTCLTCRANAPTKVSKARLDYLRAWRKMNPKGPPCAECGERLSQQSKSARPLCMGCRASTGQLAKGLRGEAA